MKQEKEICQDCGELRFVNEENICAKCWNKKTANPNEEDEAEEENSGYTILEYDLDAEDSIEISDHEYERFCDQMEKDVDEEK